MNTNMTGFRWFSKIFALDENMLSIGRVYWDDWDGACNYSVSTFE